MAELEETVADHDVTTQNLDNKEIRNPLHFLTDGCESKGNQHGIQSDLCETARSPLHRLNAVSSPDHKGWSTEEAPWDALVLPVTSDSTKMELRNTVRELHKRLQLVLQGNGTSERQLRDAVAHESQARRELHTLRSELVETQRKLRMETKTRELLEIQLDREPDGLVSTIFRVKKRQLLEQRVLIGYEEMIRREFIDSAATAWNAILLVASVEHHYMLHRPQPTAPPLQSLNSHFREGMRNISLDHLPSSATLFNSLGPTNAIAAPELDTTRLLSNLGPRKVRCLIREYYKLFQPEKMFSLDQMLAVYKGNEDELLRELQARFGSLPGVFDDSLDGGSSNEHLLSASKSQSKRLEGKYRNRTSLGARKSPNPSTSSTSRALTPHGNYLRGGYQRHLSQEAQDAPYLKRIIREEREGWRGAAESADRQILVERLHLAHQEIVKWQQELAVVTGKYEDVVKQLNRQTGIASAPHEDSFENSRAASSLNAIPFGSASSPKNKGLDNLAVAMKVADILQRGCRKGMLKSYFVSWLQHHKQKQQVIKLAEEMASKSAQGLQRQVDLMSVVEAQVESPRQDTAYIADLEAQLAAQTDAHDASLRRLLDKVRSQQVTELRRAKHHRTMGNTDAEEAEMHNSSDFLQTQMAKVAEEFFRGLKSFEDIFLHTENQRQRTNIQSNLDPDEEFENSVHFQEERSVSLVSNRNDVSTTIDGHVRSNFPSGPRQRAQIQQLISTGRRLVAAHAECSIALQDATAEIRRLQHSSTEAHQNLNSLQREKNQLQVRLKAAEEAVSMSGQPSRAMSAHIDTLEQNMFDGVELSSNNFMNLVALMEQLRRHDITMQQHERASALYNNFTALCLLHFQLEKEKFHLLGVQNVLETAGRRCSESKSPMSHASIESLTSLPPLSATSPLNLVPPSLRNKSTSLRSCTTAVSARSSNSRGPPAREPPSPKNIADLFNAVLQNSGNTSGSKVTV